ncbi:hypothetical protein V6N13_054848 [Hibiscus sabdariffa]|uniref:Secreted protein n=1 Tax=Hibiscus sabdariffa TaxID=183260 RepID=A0ABR2DWW8_9ROSI
MRHVGLLLVRSLLEYKLVATTIHGSDRQRRLSQQSGDLSNQSDPIAICLQQRCADQNSKLGGCYAIVTENLASYTSSITVAVNPGSKRCTSASRWTQTVMAQVIGTGRTLPQHCNGAHLKMSSVV